MALVRKISVLVFGDSLLQCVPLEDNLDYVYHLQSYPGMLAKDAHKDLIAGLQETKCDVLVLCLGVNDLGHGQTRETVVDCLVELHKLAIDAGVENIIACYLNEQQDRKSVV